MEKLVYGVFAVVVAAWLLKPYFLTSDTWGTGDSGSGLELRSGADTFRLGEARAVSGHDIEIKSHRFRLNGVTCPAPDTERGLEAKALMNTFLRTNIRCQLRRSGGFWTGDCTANGKNVASGLVSSGLCDRA